MKEKISWKIFIVFVAGLFLLKPVIGAEEEKKEEEEKPFQYNSETSLSLVLVRGNNRNFSFSFDTEQEFKIKKYNKFEYQGKFIKANSNGEKKTEIYYSHIKYDRKIQPRSYILGFVRYERNKLAGYNYRLALSFGGGGTWIETDNIDLSTELAFGWNNENNTKRVDVNLNNSSSIWKETINASFISSLFTGKFSYKISKTSKIVHEDVIFLNTEELEDFRLNSVSSVYASINSRLALKTSVQIIYQNLPVEGYKNTDMYFLSSLVIKI
jgi:putative salt-induced outer membrane protein YdiY